MTLNDLGNIGELVGGTAVAVSVLYLAVQIRHSSQISRFEAHRELSNKMTSVFGTIAADADLYRIWKVMTGSPESATDDDSERFGMLLYQIFSTFSDADRFGKMDKELRARSQIYMDRFLHFPAVQAWWARQGENFHAPFRSKVDARLSEIIERAGA